MFLKALEMFGFKSFPEKTRLEFGDGTTTIVGPNGCGKSNVTDALRWVLGEKSAKALRGDHMEDVIFMGSTDLKPMSMCSVTIFLDNSDNSLPGKFSELEITRKLYRSGESEYFINKQPALLKDINEIFMDTGIGKNNYAFVQQGQISGIIDKKPEERRLILEEAAGISKYKAKKMETQVKLAQTRENLIRLHDIMDDLDKRRTTLKGQAEKAEKAKKIDDEIREKEIQNHSFDYKTLLKRTTEETDRLANLEKKSEAIADEIKKIEEAIKTAYDTLNQTHNDKNFSEKEIMSVEGKIVSLGQQADHYRAQIQSLELNIGENNNQIESFLEKKKIIDEKLEASREQYNAKKEAIEGLKKEADESRQKLDQVTNESGKILADMENLKKEISSLSHEIDNARLKMKEVIDELVKQIDARKEELVSSQAERNQQNDDFFRHIDSVKMNIVALLDSVNNNSISIDDFRIKLEYSLKELENVRSFSTTIVSMHDGFQDIIFDKRGIHAQKENIENRIREMEQEQVAKQNTISVLENRKTQLAVDQEILQSKLTELNTQLAKLNAQMESKESEIRNFTAQSNEYDENVAQLRKSIKEKEGAIAKLREEIGKTSKEQESFEQKMHNMKSAMEGFDSNIKKINDSISSNQSKKTEKKKQFEEIRDRITNVKVSISGLEQKTRDIRELLFENYGENIDETSKGIKEDLNIQNVRQRIQKLKEERSLLGVINPMAIEEHKEQNDRYKFLLKQRQDIEKAEQDCKDALDRIDTESQKLFMEAFKVIRENYITIIRKMFRGGKADIILETPEDPLNSPVHLLVQPPGKRVKLSQLSGGEKALSAISLIFAIFLTKPSPFCVLDEIDAPLDDQNALLLVNLISEFKTLTKFIIVSHNKNVIASSDRIYGVSMEDLGVTKIVSLVLSDLNSKQVKDKFNIKDSTDNEKDS